jgi:adenylate cyclase
MSDQLVYSPRELLEQTQKKLDLVMAIDRIRDTAPDPTAMLSMITSLIVDRLRSELCMMCLFDRETQKLELKVVNDRGEWLARLGMDTAYRLAVRVAEMDGRIVLGVAKDILPELGLSGPPSNLFIAGVPIVVKAEERLGSLVLARAGSPFRQPERELLDVIESQLDSTVIQGYVYEELQQRNKELETIYRVDRIRDQTLAFDDMLAAVLQELRRGIQAEMGFIMLYNHTGGHLELRATTHDDLFKVPSYAEMIDQIGNEALQKAELVYHNDLPGRLNSVMCIPLILHNSIIGVFGVINRYGGDGFDESDRRLLQAIASQIDTAIFEGLEQRRLRQVLGRSVDPRVMQRLLASPNVGLLKGERAVVSVLYADIRGSTNLAERTDPELLVGFINEYLGRMSEVVLGHEGTLDKFVGDEVMALFGVPFPQDDHALRAVRAGLEMQIAHQEVMERWRQRGVEAAPIGVGIATGELIAGEMGSPQRTQYTVIGRAANLGARICGVAKAGQVLISQQTYDQVKDQIEAKPITGMQFKGVEHEVTIYEVMGVVA